MTRWRGFVLFAEMRTGSNHLEASLNAMDGVTSHGEAFNPHFVGYPKREEVLGVTLAERTARPAALIEAMERAEGLNGFRFFHDHDLRAVDAWVDDPRVAKIVLRRDPLQSFVSLAIARETGQWKLTNVKFRKTAKIRFDPAAYEAHRAATEGWARVLRRRLAASGQVPFQIDYEEIGDLAVLNGLATWLGASPLGAVPGALKRQNPPDLRDKVENYAEMIAAVGAPAEGAAGPIRGGAVPTWQVAAAAPLIHLPIRSGPEDRVTAWMAALDGAAPSDGLTQKTLRQWRRRNPAARAFTVLRHPVARAHHAFCTKILATGAGTYPEIRQTLRRHHAVPIPNGPPGADWDPAAHRAAFLGFLAFVKENLAGQTAIRIDAHWATQLSVVQGFGNVLPPDAVLREDALKEGLGRLAADLGLTAPAVPAEEAPGPIPLDAISDGEVEEAARAAYPRDYLMFGFGPWRP